jgi:hypothetical protein
MVITVHGVSAPFFKGVTTINGQRLTFFGPSVVALLLNLGAWLDKNPTPPTASGGAPAPAAMQEAA